MSINLSAPADEAISQQIPWHLFLIYLFRILHTNIVAARVCCGQLWLGVALTVVVVVSGIFQYYQDSKSSKIMKAFEKLVPHVSWFTTPQILSCMYLFLTLRNVLRRCTFNTADYSSKKHYAVNK